MKINLLASSIIALSAFVSFNASAYDAYNLHSDKWAIECSDGELASFSGDEAGLKNAGGALCEAHGGLAGAKEEMTVKKFADAEAASPLSEGRAGESATEKTAEGTEKDQAVSTEDATGMNTKKAENPADDSKK
jgi:hypothetical protein